MVSIIEAERLRREEWQPRFWRKAATSAEASTSWFSALLEREDAAAFVSEASNGTVEGFLIATLVDAPPVYAPGGKTCMIDDFAVARDDMWQATGRQLLDAAQDWASAQGAAQTLVVAAKRHDEKLKLMQEAGLCQVSTWWVSPA